MRELFVCLLIFTAAIFGFYHYYPHEKSKDTEQPSFNDRIKKAPFPNALKRNSEPVFEENKVSRNVTPDDVLPLQKLEADKLERLPALEPPPLPERPPKPKLRPRPLVLAAGIIKSGDTQIILSDINPIKPDQKCKLESGGEWPCGKLAETEMKLFVRGRPINCTPTQNDNAKKIITRCELDGFDMSAWLVLTGWAIPKGSLFQSELKEAKAKKRGQWRTTGL